MKYLLEGNNSGCVYTSISFVDVTTSDPVEDDEMSILVKLADGGSLYLAGNQTCRAFLDSFRDTSEIFVDLRSIPGNSGESIHRFLSDGEQIY